MNKLRIAKLKVYKDFSLGVSMAWFTAGVVNLFFNNDFSSKSLFFSLIGILASWIFLQFAVEYTQKVDNYEHR